MGAFLSRLDLRARNLGEMVQRCGIDPVAMAQERLGQTLISLTRACISCRHGDTCRSWLDAADRHAVIEPPSFCPNAERFREAR